ncbi:hypothetical protein ACTOB_003050 [Actinoplanes oblitus]|uniref:Uncharacterized protein n=1 Tax=Actinoplanes oblitus TaxID=3040509 RepID=A0ABY8WNF4_9ACTN|nr:hypothetical protein [Actinoplanes oblitus]WIM99399.1 hypothetical protein ACTOB_003050 [Actinoplanes oblitus]
MKPVNQPLYLIVLTTAILVDRTPSAALIREFGINNTKLRKAILGESLDKEPSLADIIAAAGDE